VIVVKKVENKLKELNMINCSLERTLSRMDCVWAILETERHAIETDSSGLPAWIAAGCLGVGGGAVLLASLLPNLAPALGPIILSTVIGAGIGSGAGLVLGPAGLAIAGQAIAVPTAAVLGLIGAYTGASGATWGQLAIAAPLLAAKVLCGFGVACILVGGAILVFRLLFR
jgi:hypothetical protein